MAATAQAKPGEVVRRFFGLLEEGKTEEMIDLVSDSAVIRESFALPFGGEYRGPSGMRDLLHGIRRMNDVAAIDNVEIEFFDTAGEQVVVRMGFRATNRTTGRSMESRVVEIYTVRDGKVVDLDVFYRDPSMVAKIAPADLPLQ